MKDIVLQVLMLRIALKFSREFREETRACNCWIRGKASNSLEIFLVVLMIEYAECLIRFCQIGGSTTLWLFEMDDFGQNQPKLCR